MNSGNLKSFPCPDSGEITQQSRARREAAVSFSWRDRTPWCHQLMAQAARSLTHFSQFTNTINFNCIFLFLEAGVLGLSAVLLGSTCSTPPKKLISICISLVSISSIILTPYKITPSCLTFFYLY